MLYKSIVMPKQVLDNHLLEEGEEGTLSNIELFKKIKIRLVVYFFISNIVLFWMVDLMAHWLNVEDGFYPLFLILLMVMPSGIFCKMIHNYFPKFFSRLFEQSSSKNNIPIPHERLFNKADFVLDKINWSFYHAIWKVLLVLFLFFIATTISGELENWILEHGKLVFFFLYLLYLKAIVTMELEYFTKKFSQEQQPTNS